MSSDTIVAIAAIVVSGLVSAGTLIATNNHDNSRLHAERAQTDRAELRKVLDDASTALYIMDTRFRSQLPVSSRSRVGNIPAIDRQIDELNRRLGQLAIRLGRDASATKAMRHARATAENAYVYLEGANANASRHADQQAAVKLARRFVIRLHDYGRDVLAFVDAANRVAASTTE